jgi:glycerophosphoryl diester phosphodiesterase
LFAHGKAARQAVAMKDSPMIIAHRGASHAAPENTLPAFARAWREGADGIECDVRLSADGEVVCLHDPDTARVADRQMVVASAQWADLRVLDVGLWKGPEFSGVSIPLLSEVVAQVPPGKKLMIELKTGKEILQPLFTVLDACQLEPRQIAVITFDPLLVEALKAARPDLRVFWLINVRSNWLGRSKLKLADVLDRIIELDADGLGLRCHSGIHREMVKAILEADLHLNVWTVDDAVDARRYASFGVTSITTNRPRALLDALLD